MSATTSATTGATNGERERETDRSVVRPIPMGRVVGIELRKMFDTRSGFWLMTSIVALSVIASGAVIIFGKDGNQSYGSFAQAFGIPMSIILPVVAILAVTSEWSQRSGLTTFTLVPHRGRVIGAKAVATAVVAVVSMAIAFAIGALGTIVGSAVHGTDVVWDISFSDALYITAGYSLGMAMGFMLGSLIRNSAGAIVGYFVYSFVVPTLSGLLATQSWWRDAQPWADFSFDQFRLYDGGLSAQEWAQTGVAGLIWLVIPLTVGLVMLMRSEVK
jgi:ABC-2 type transport system permease protein